MQGEREVLPTPFRSAGIMRRLAPFMAAGGLGFTLLDLPALQRETTYQLAVLGVLFILTASMATEAWEGVPPRFQVVIPAAYFGLLLWPASGAPAQRLSAFAAIALVIGALAAATLAPMDRIPRRLQSVPPLMAAAAFMLMLAGPVPATPTLILSLLPLLWLALYHSRGELLAGIAVTVTSMLVASALEPRELVVAEGLLSVALISVVSLLVHALVARSRDEAHAMARHVEVLAEEVVTDPLTGVANRRSWDRQLTRHLAAGAGRGEPLTVVLLDLDHYKEYNDEWGHQKGDALLQRVAAAWRSALREVDFLARYGGDEFAAILPNCGAEGALAIVERLRASTPDGQGWSAGLAVWDGAEGPADLVARADHALYEMKRSRRGGSLVASPLAPVIELAASAHPGLDEILARGAILPAYQPVCDLEAGRVIGVEAFARVEGGSTTDSIKALFDQARQRGRVPDLDLLCRREALQGASAASEAAPLFLNVDGAVLVDALRRSEELLEMARDAGRAATDVVLELSETNPPRDLARLSLAASAYREHGFRFCLDDVGDGANTLQLLAALMPEYIKVSAALLRAVENRSARATLRAVAAFAAASGATIIAEGLETAQDMAAARRMKIRFGQGYAVGAPSWEYRPEPPLVAPIAGLPA